MAKQIVRLEPLGINYDQPPHKLGPEVWSGGYNVAFEDGRARKTKGSYLLDPPLLHVARDLRYTPSPSDFWVYTGPTGVGVWDGVSQHDITPVDWINTGVAAQPAPQGVPAGGPTQNLCLINNIVVVNNTIAGPYYWGGVTGSPCVPLPGWADLPANSTCNQMESNLYHLFALGMTEGAADFNGSRVRWSDAAPPGTVPGEWAPTAANQAGFVDLATPVGSIVGGLTLRENLMVYKQRSTHMFQYVGGPFVYNVSPTFETVGLLAPGAVCELDGTHVMVTQDDIVQHDGNTVTSVADKSVKREFFQNLKRDLAHLVHVHLNRTSEQIWIFYPDLTAKEGCNRILVYCYTDQTWSQRLLTTDTAYCADVGRYSGGGAAGTEWDKIPENGIDTWQQWLDSWDYTTSSASSNYHVIGTKQYLAASTTQSEDNGAPISALLEKTGMDLGKIDSQKRLTRAWPRFEEGAGNTVQFQFGASEYANKEPVWSAPVNYLIGTDRSIPVNVQGRAIAVRLIDSGVDMWALTGIDLEFREAGKF